MRMPFSLSLSLCNSHLLYMATYISTEQWLIATCELGLLSIVCFLVCAVLSLLVRSQFEINHFWLRFQVTYSQRLEVSSSDYEDSQFKSFSSILDFVKCVACSASVQKSSSQLEMKYWLPVHKYSIIVSEWSKCILKSTKLSSFCILIIRLSKPTSTGFQIFCRCAINDDWKCDVFLRRDCKYFTRCFEMYFHSLLTGDTTKHFCNGSHNSLCSWLYDQIKQFGQMLWEQTYDRHKVK